PRYGSEVHGAVSARRGGIPARLRTAVSVTATVALVATVGACTWIEDQLSVEFVDEAPASTVLPGEDASQAAVALSSSLFASADGAVVATEDTVEALAEVSSRSRLPLLIGTDRSVADELDRLGADTVVTAEGPDVTALDEDLDIGEGEPADAEVKPPEEDADAEPGRASMF